jgi:hypothetical protein
MHAPCRCSSINTLSLHQLIDMLTYFIEFVKNINKTKAYLILASILLVFFLILLNNFKVIPLRIGDFIFFAVLTLAFALYRPGWAFLFFVGTIALENINLAPENLGMTIRPYQLLGALIILAVAIRFFSKKLYFSLPKLEWFDYLLLAITTSGFLSILNAPDKIASFKLAIILATFFALYYLVRVYIQNNKDLKRIVPFFISSGIVVISYGIWQNWRFMHNLASFETMPGRPNSVFAEADWLGMFLVLFMSVIYALLYKISNDQIKNAKYKIINTKCVIHATLYILLILSCILLILTVSRSAWLGAFFATFIFLWAVFTDFKFKNWQWKKTIKIKMGIICSLIISIAAVYIFHLTNFQLFNRAASATSGLQKITISCSFPSEIHAILKEKVSITINDVFELEKYNCRHINLEEIEIEKKAGNRVYEIYRKDPNVQTRSEIYRKSWEQIKSHPILGIGWGSISSVLGKDERGAGLNSSNIFLEIWLGSGIFGFLAFVIFWFYIIFNAVKNFYFTSDALQKAIYLFIIISWIGLTVANLFNAGILLGFLWIYMGIALIKE